MSNTPFETQYADLLQGGRYHVILTHEQACALRDSRELGLTTLDEAKQQQLNAVLVAITNQIWPEGNTWTSYMNVPAADDDFLRDRPSIIDDCRNHDKE